VLTEASNLLGNQEEWQEALRTSVRGWEELRVEAPVVMDDPAFARLGFADAMTLRVAGAATEVITVDVPLYYELLAREHRAINLNHAIDLK
jgi:hypothetical protein